jgi:hypothetical protein
MLAEPAVTRWKRCQGACYRALVPLYRQKSAITMWLATLITIATLIYQVYQGERAVDPSNIDIWAANNAYRQSCQRLLLRGMRSTHCNMALAMPLLPPPSTNTATASSDDELFPEEHTVKGQAIALKEDRSELGRRLASRCHPETVPGSYSDDRLGDSSSHRGLSKPRAEALVPSFQPRQSSVKLAWSGQPSLPNTSLQDLTVSYMSPAYIFATIIITVVMYIGLYLCVRKRRSLKHGHIEEHPMTGTHRKSSMPAAQSNFLCAEDQSRSRDGNHCLDHKDPDGIAATPERRIVLQARWQVPKQRATSPRRRRRRYHYLCGSYHSSRRRTDTESVNTSMRRADEHRYSDTELASLEEAMDPKETKVYTGHRAEPAE